MGNATGQAGSWAPGPFQTELEARNATRHIYESPPGTGAWGNGNHKLLEDACRSAGITLGAFDHGILLWLAGFEPSTCAVIAGLIARASRDASHLVSGKAGRA
jgi:hypothetical protein